GWVDVASGFVPLVDVLPILRLMRLTGLLEFQQVGRLSRLYRLRGLVSRGWRAAVLLEVIQRLFGHYRENRLLRLKKLLAAREEEIAGVGKEIAEVEELFRQEKERQGVHLRRSRRALVMVRSPASWPAGTTRTSTCRWYIPAPTTTNS